jgi:hypothetical protein
MGIIKLRGDYPRAYDVATLLNQKFGPILEESPVAISRH